MPENLKHITGKSKTMRSTFWLGSVVDRWEAKHPVFWRKLQNGLFVPIGFFVFACIVINGSIELYQAVDHSGWWSHDADTQVMFSGEWLTGEYKTCAAILINGEQETRDGPGPHLFCTDTENKTFHTLPVRYWGRISRPEKIGIDTIDWKCQRSSERLTCWAQD